MIDSVRDIRHAVAPKQTLPPPLSPYPAPPPGAAGGAYGAAGGINAAGGRNADGSFNSSGYMNSAGHINPADGSYNAGDMSNHMNSLSLGKFWTKHKLTYLTHHNCTTGRLAMS